MVSESFSKPHIARIETSNIPTSSSNLSLNQGASRDPTPLSSNTNNVKSPISASKTAAFFGESHVFQPPKSHFRSASNSSNSSRNGGSRMGSSSGESRINAGSDVQADRDRGSLVSSSSSPMPDSSSEHRLAIQTDLGAGRVEGRELPVSESLLSIHSVDSNLDRSWESSSRNDLSSNSILVNPDFKSGLNTMGRDSNDQLHHQNQNQLPNSSSNSFSSRWAGGFGSSLQPQPQSSNSLFETGHHPNNISFGNGSVRSRRNWDEFEGKPITPLPSPSLSSTSTNRFNFGSSSNEKEEEGGNLSAIGFGMNSKSQSIGNLSTSSNLFPSSSSSDIASKTESFFKSSRTPRPPTNRKSSGSSGFSSPDEPPSRSNSLSENKFSLHQTTRLPTLLTGSTIPGSSNVTGSSLQSSSSDSRFKGGNSSAQSWLGAGHMRSSSGESDPNLSGDTNRGILAESPMMEKASDSDRFKNLRTQKESGWGTLSSGYSPTSSRLRESDRNGQESTVKAGSGSSLSNSSMDFLMAPEGSSTNGRRNNGTTTRHTHGPSENASGSSLVPHFYKDQDGVEQKEEGDSQSFHRRGKSKEGLPTTSDGANTFLFQNPEHEPLENGNLKIKTTSRLPSSSHSPDERIGDKTKNKEEDNSFEVENEKEGLIGPYKLVSILGVGAFSKVVLGERYRDFDSNANSQNSNLSKLVHSNQGHLDAPEVFVRRPSVTNQERMKPRENEESNSNSKSQGPGQGVRDSGNQTKSKSAEDRLVALKIMAKEPCKQNERMRVSWVREVEVLKHISHPCLARFISSFSTPTQHVLVIERIAGGELFDFLDKNQVEISKREWLVRRCFAELAHAVGWMHSVNLVHRDLKLENVILTTKLFETSKDLLPSSLPPIPLLKITDFGLSRFVDPNGPLLETRCGSEEYAAPELIIGKRYDGRQTDVWALGVILYALLTGSIPFLDDNPSSRNPREDSKNERDSKQRKSHLLRIAKGDLRWPEKTNDESKDQLDEGDLGLRLITPRARNFVSKLLRRDCNKRILAWDSWDDPWLLEGSFLGNEKSQRGQTFDLQVKDPRSTEGKKWLKENAGVRGEKLSEVVLDD